jgi:hypothetical protein
MIERNYPVTSARVITVIATVSHRGSGTDADPLRLLYQYWDCDGGLLAEHDTRFDDDTDVEAVR